MKKTAAKKFDRPTTQHSPEQIENLKSILKTEKDGRLFAIAMLGEMEEEWEDSLAAGLESHRIISEEEITEGQRDVGRTAPQSDTFMRWTGDVFKYATPEAFNGYFAIMTDFVGVVVQGEYTLENPSEHYLKLEQSGELERFGKWGTVNYSNPEAAAAAIASGEMSYPSAATIAKHDDETQPDEPGTRS